MSLDDMDPSPLGEFFQVIHAGTVIALYVFLVVRAIDDGDHMGVEHGAGVGCVQEVYYILHLVVLCTARLARIFMIAV